jgi:hypothetical protein
MTTTMIDAIGASAGHIPASAPKVAGYVTGTGVVPWDDADWARFPHSGHVRIDQSPAGATYAAGKADVYDIENLAGTPAHFPGLVKTRLAGGLAFCDFYASRATVAQVAAALDAAGPAHWYGSHVRLWLADWNLSLNEAEDAVGTHLGGFLIVAVQWASPSSNPNTPLPGTSMTLSQANCDLSATADYWHAPPPVKPPPEPRYGYLVTEAGIGNAQAFTGRAVTSPPPPEAKELWG